MTRMDEILAPARAIVQPVVPVPTAKGATKKSVRTYYRRRDGLVTQRAIKVWIPVVGRSHQWDYMDRVDTCRAHDTAEAIRIFKSRTTPEDAQPVKGGDNATRH